ncbi:MAG: FimB/Mfa2 family fimbrial subunit, partial [Bacteroidales bacterium]|nr:FimB/Mfa2 family fimbrial subunit [Bacteroidales bacterium]
MKQLYADIVRLICILLGLLTFSSCILDDENDCCYNVQLEYRYQRYATLGNNELGFYVGKLREYVFNGQDLLVAVNDYLVPHGNDAFFSEQSLLPGRYTVIAIGNKNGSEAITIEQIGVTTRQEILVRLTDVQENPNALRTKKLMNDHRLPDEPEITEVHGRSDRLYYGYRTFMVNEYGISRIAMDMTHAHCVLGVTVRWIDASGHPMAGETYNLTLRQVPSLSRFMPEFLVTNALDAGTFEAETETFPSNDHRRINYIPGLSRVLQVCHTVDGSVNGNVLYGEFISFRYRSDSHVLLSIYSSTERV